MIFFNNYTGFLNIIVGVLEIIYKDINKICIKKHLGDNRFSSSHDDNKCKLYI